VNLRRLQSAFVLLLTVAGVSGCAGTPVTQDLIRSPPSGLPRTAEVGTVPFYPQTENHCGPAALATVLNFSGLKTTPETLSKSVYTPGRQGTLQTEIVTGVQRRGRLALPVAGMKDAFREVANGRPILVLQNLGLDFAPQWHYAVLVGYDLNDEHVVLRSGKTRRLIEDMGTFEHTWRRSGFWGVSLARPEGPVPETVSMSSWLRAALGLERAGRPADAVTAYWTAADRWHRAATPLVLAANVMIGQDDLDAAERTLRAALRRDEDNAVALNNLANVLMLREKWSEAESVARAAVDAGGRTSQAAAETLSTIRKARPGRP